MVDTGVIFKRCGCRNDAGRRLDRSCPHLRFVPRSELVEVSRGSTAEERLWQMAVYQWRRR